MIRLRTATLGVLSLGSALAAQVVKDFQFDTAGLLPSADPEIEFFTTTGQPESSIFAVAGGVLTQTIPGLTGVSTYNWPNVAQSGGSLDPGKILVVEARLRVTSAVGVGALVQALNGQARVQLMLQSGDQALLLTSTGTAAASVGIADFHTYRLEVAGGSSTVRLLIDGVLRLSETAPATSLNGFAWGDGFFPVGNSGDAEWDFIRVEQSPACRPDCEEDFDLDLFDFLCFQGRFSVQDPYADFEQDGDWDLFDFLAFQGSFADGCP